MSGYVLNKRSAGQLVKWGNIYKKVQESRSGLWGYAMIEDVVNVLNFGVWEDSSWQLFHNIFGQTEGLDSLEGNGVESDNHPATLVLGGG